MRVIRCDGSPATVAALHAALRDVLAGGETVVPLGPDDPPPVERAPDRGHVVVTTSGSTGEPKRVLLGADALLASARATERRLGGPARWLLALPAQHVAGLQVLVRSIVAGTDPVVLDLRGGFDPAALTVPDAPRRATSLVPTQLVRVLDTDPAVLTALTAFDAVLLGGAAAPPGSLRAARRAGVRVTTTYGMSETCGGCVYDGEPLDGVAVRLGDGGRVELAGPVLARGYLGGPAIGPWFATSDLGRWDGQRLQVLGRLDDVVVTGGVNVAPAEVEAVLAALPGVAAVCVVGVPDAEWGERLVAAVVPAGPPPDPAALLAAARRRLSGPRVPKEIVLLADLPLRGIGKPDRRAVRDLVVARGTRRVYGRVHPHQRHRRR